MATVTSGGTFATNMEKGAHWPVTNDPYQVVVATSSLYQISFMAYWEPNTTVFHGAFVYDGLGALDSGTITQIDVYQNGVINYTISNLSLSVATFLSTPLSGETGLDGNDVITGNPTGFNTLYGYAGDDMITGGAFQDYIFGGTGADTMEGGAGNDSYFVDNVGDVVTDASGNDSVESQVSFTLGAGIETLALVGSAVSGTGNALANRLFGNAVDNVLHGGAGNDQVEGQAGNDVLRGDEGADTLNGGDGDDWIEGETGNDPFSGVAGNDMIHGGAGSDTVLGGAGNDTISGDSGTDFLVGEAGNDTIHGGEEWDAIDGRSGADQLFGDGGADIIFGDAGTDTLYGGDGDDMIMGERGENTSIGDTDVIFGGAGNDMLDGSAGNDTIYGEDGNDIIDGDIGNDLIVGGAGSEIIAGSDYNGVAGHDQFIYLAMSDAGDSIYGFRTTPGNNDQINLASLFDSLGYTGTNAVGDGYLHVVEASGNTYVFVDGSGPADGAHLTLMATLVGTSLSAGGQPLDGYFIYQ
jgi:Ca2+-binding RTX toxin-like protein